MIMWYFRLSFISGYPSSKQEHKGHSMFRGHDVTNTLFWSSTQRTEFLSYFVDIISYLDRMFLCRISFSKTYSISRIFNFFCRLLCYPFSLFIPLQPHCADRIKNYGWIRKKWHDTRLSNSSCQSSCVCVMWTVGFYSALRVSDYTACCISDARALRIAFSSSLQMVFQL